MPRETKFGMVVSVVVGVLGSLLTTGTIVFIAGGRLAALETRQEAIVQTVRDLQADRRRDALQVTALATSLAESRARVSQAMEGAVNFHNDIRKIADDLRAQNQWAHDQIERLRERSKR